MRKRGHRWKTKVTEPRSGVSQEFTVEATNFEKATAAARELYMEGVDFTVGGEPAVAMLNRLVVEVTDLGPIVPDDPLPARHDPMRPRPTS
jgi:hypothetical protein